jgi:hypothetical protein
VKITPFNVKPHRWYLGLAEEKVLVLTPADKPGSLAFIASKLADLGINIRHAYAGAADTKRYLGVSDLTQARKGLR